MIWLIECHMKSTQKAIQARTAKSDDEEWNLYEIINEHPGSNIYQLSKLMAWTTGKTRGAVKRLEEEGLIKIEKTLKDGRAVDLVTPTHWQEFFTKEELEEFKIKEI